MLFPTFYFLSIFFCSVQLSQPFAKCFPQISEESRYRRKTLLFSLAGFNLEWLIQHITDAAVLVTNEELARIYGKGLPCFRD